MTDRQPGAATHDQAPDHQAPDHHAIARALLAKAHAPYSRFPVAAVVVTRAGGEFHGVNVENAAYGSTICAERMAIGAMLTAGDRSGIARIVVAGHGDDPLTPCGACRQVIAEFSRPDTVVTSRSDDGQQAAWTVAELLPAAFGPLRLAAGADITGADPGRDPGAEPAPEPGHEPGPDPEPGGDVAPDPTPGPDSTTDPDRTLDG